MRSITISRSIRDPVAIDRDAPAGPRGPPHGDRLVVAELDADVLQHRHRGVVDAQKLLMGHDVDERDAPIELGQPLQPIGRAGGAAGQVARPAGPREGEGGEDAPVIAVAPSLPCDQPRCRRSPAR